MMFLLKLHADWLLFKYRFQHKMFSWKVDDEGDVCFVIFDLIGFLKYKEHTIIRGPASIRKMTRAPKYMRGE